MKWYSEDDSFSFRLFETDYACLSLSDILVSFLLPKLSINVLATAQFERVVSIRATKMIFFYMYFSFFD